jgi:hypothetical protein
MDANAASAKVLNFIKDGMTAAGSLCRKEEERVEVLIERLKCM